MRTSRFSETEIVYDVKQLEMGIPVREIARKYGTCENTVCRWRGKYDGLSPSELKRLKELERENSQLKKLVAELSLDKQILQNVLQRKLRSLRASGICSLSCSRTTRPRSAGRAGYSYCTGRCAATSPAGRTTGHCGCG